MKYQFSFCRSIAALLIVALFYMFLKETSFVFTNMRAIVTTPGLCFLLMFIVYELEFLQFIPHAFRVLFFRPLESNIRFSQMALFGSRSAVGAGLVCMLVELIHMLANLSSPSNVTAAMAISLVYPFYAVVLSEIFFAVVHQSFNDPQSKTKMSSALPLVNAGLPLLFILFSVCIYLISVFSFSHVIHSEELL